MNKMGFVSAKALVVLFSLFGSASLVNAEVGVNGVSIDMDMSDVVSMVGEPDKSRGVADWFDVVHEYEKMMIHAYYDGVIVGVESDKEGVCASDGVCVGDVFDFESARHSDYEKCCEEVYTKYSYANMVSECGVLIHAENSVVTRVAAICIP